MATTVNIAIPISGVSDPSTVEDKYGGAFVGLKWQIFTDAFDDSSLDSNWGADTANSGTVIEGASGVDLDAPATTDAAFIWAARQFNRAQVSSGTDYFTWVMNTNQTAFVAVGFERFSGTPADRTGAAGKVGGYCFVQSGPVVIFQWINAAGTAYYFNPTTKVWSTSLQSYNISTATTYTTELEANGSEWRFNLYSGAGTGGSLLVQTTWVPIANTYAPAGDDYIVFGDPLNNAGQMDVKVTGAITSLGYSTASPVVGGPWTDAPLGSTLDFSTAAITGLKDGVALAAGDTELTFQYATNNGAYNGSWLTLTQLRAETAVKVTDEINAIRIKVRLTAGSDTELIEVAKTLTLSATGVGGGQRTIFGRMLGR